MRLVASSLLVVALAVGVVALSKSDKEAQIRTDQEEMEAAAASEVKEAEQAKEQRVYSGRKKSAETQQYRPRSLTKDSILEDHSEISDGERRFPSVPVVAYVTPWNNKGYDRAVAIASKLTHVAPVWLQLKPATADGAKACRIVGQHDIDHEWMERLKEKNGALKITPRVLFEGWTGEQLLKFVQDEEWSRRCIDDTNALLRRNRFDGVVVEVWLSALVATRGSSHDAMMMLAETLASWGKALHDHDMQIIVPIPPPVFPNGQYATTYFAQDYWDVLAEGVDFIQIMTHDYKPDEGAHHYPNAPLKWVERNVIVVTGDAARFASKVLVGLNHYGIKTDFGAGKQDAIMGDEYIKLLGQKGSTLEWDNDAEEHYVKNDRIEAYFPTLTSLEARTILALEYGTGISIWDLGQGLDYFARVL